MPWLKLLGVALIALCSAQFTHRSAADFEDALIALTLTCPLVSFIPVHERIHLGTTIGAASITDAAPKVLTVLDMPDAQWMSSLGLGIARSFPSSVAGSTPQDR